MAIPAPFSASQVEKMISDLILISFELTSHDGEKFDPKIDLSAPSFLIGKATTQQNSVTVQITHWFAQ